MSLLPPGPIDLEFRLDGALEPMRLAMPPGPAGHIPRRALGGWLMVYALLGPNGGLTPVRDRDRQVMEAASELGRIDWSEYLRKGHWNDTHDESVIVGHATNLEFHDQTTPLAKAHGKTGFWTSGHLWDRNDPDSWRLYTDHVPREEELRKADRFWGLAEALDGLPRSLGLSAHGWMKLSACKSRALAAKCDAAAVCELPKNPATTLEILRRNLEGSPLEFMRKGMVNRHDRPCRTCSCPPGAACLPLRAALNPRDNLWTDPADIDGNGHIRTPLDSMAPADRIEALIATIQRMYFVDRDDAIRWIDQYLESRRDGAGKE